MSSYFTMPSFARAKKNKEDLEKTNPQEPMLKDEDEKYLQRVASTHDATEGIGEEQSKEAQEATEETTQEKAAKTSAGDDDSAVPQDKAGEIQNESETQSSAEAHETADVVDAAKESVAKDEGVVEPPDQVPEDRSASPASQKKSKKNKGIDLPSQEDAEAATGNFPAEPTTTTEQAQQGDKRTWASYLPSLGSVGKKDESLGQKTAASDEQVDKRTWTEYASSYVPSASSLPSMPNMPNLPAMPSWSRSKDAAPEPVYNEDGSVNEEKTKEKQEQEVSVLLDNLNASSINNRVFALSGPMQEYYSRFTQVLKDTIDGAPTAYEDMDKLMKDAGPQLQKQYESMPPFVQMLVKSLPAKLGTTLGPELLAAASEKPGADAQKLQAASNRRREIDPTALGSMSTNNDKTSEGEAKKQKQKQKTPGMRKLVNQKGAVATALNSIVNFIKIRFPFLASATNVLMSLAVFILMLVFWYCHKRGREVRLAKASAAEAEAKAADGEDEESPEEYDATDDEEAAEALLAEKAEASNTYNDKSQNDNAHKFTHNDDDAVAKEIEETLRSQDAEGIAKQDMVNKESKNSNEVPLPEGGGHSNSEKEAEKAIGV